MAKMSIWRPKKDILFQTAKNKVTNLTTVIEEGVKPDLIQNRFIRIVENNPNSPLIMGLGENKHLIFYPANSTPYLHQYETSIKYVEVLSGEIFDQLTEKRYKSGDRFKIFPGVQIKPYTKDLECYVRVCVTSIDTIWENVCT